MINRAQIRWKLGGAGNEGRLRLIIKAGQGGGHWGGGRDK